ncbi:hypothetical protein QQX98_012998 [Neonectria punicea]|uniref:non-specific serine/threonine protein kinase n=1 Tax=Neonectria punicea TaxID=979145 RepID=A0ABR1GHE3_9HYPO
MPPRLQRSKPKPKGRHARGSTEPPENAGAPDLNFQPRIEIRFSNIPRTDRGVIFGANSNCDVVLNCQGVSNYHFSLTFDEMNRPIVQDLGSSMGTEVTYGTEGHGVRSDFRWIVGGARVLRKKRDIIIRVIETISFRIVVPRHDIASQAYIDKVNWFRQGTATAEDLLGDLGLPRDTKLHTGAQTPGTGAIYLKKRLGEGGFGVVTHYWNVSDGSEFALKQPSAKAIRARLQPNIVKLFESPPTPYPELRLEYARCGSLSDQENISADETQSILNQCLSALIYLHEHEPPIVHRDIKPDNILVQHRFPGNIYVKFGDFGLARDSHELMTICGTPYYQAPEIYLQWQRFCFGEERSTYTAAVDIWSLGVVGYELMYGLPQYKSWYKDGGTAWCDKIVAKFQQDLQKRPHGLGRFPLSGMVVTSPDIRYTARQCYELSIGTNTGWQTASYTKGGTQTTHPYGSGDYIIDDQETAIFQPGPCADDYATVSPYHESSFVRSEAPPPESRTTRERVATSKASGKRAATSKTPGKRAAMSKALSSLPSSTQFSTKRRGRRSSRREPIPSERQELAYFLEGYSQDPLNSLYVGSSTAAWVGLEGSEDWESQYSYGSSLQSQPDDADTQIYRGSGPVSARNRPSMPRGQGDRWRPENDSPITGDSIPTSGTAQFDDEMWMAAQLLQGMAQDDQR